MKTVGKTITRERLQELAEGQSGFNLRTATHEESQELARMALAAMDSAPYGFTDGDRRGMIYKPEHADRLNEPVPVYRHAQPAPRNPVGVINGAREPVLYGEHIGIAIGTHLYAEPQPAPVVQPMMFIDGDISSEDADKLAKVIREFNEEDERPLAKMARIIRENPHPTNECDMPKSQPQPASERDQVRQEHAEWSQGTFGNVGPVGPLKHLSKEALETAAEAGDLSEWADMQFLLWDAQRRAGITDEQITQAMIDKLAVNKQREWPEPKDGEPRLHIKSQPAPQEVKP